MFDKSYRAAVVQMNSQTNMGQNLEQAYNLIHQAAKNKVRLVGLPENFAFLGGLKMRQQHAREIAERVPDFLSETAREFQIYLIGGSYPVPTDDGRVYNHCAVYGPEGNLLSEYDKIHLFDVSLSEEETYRESSYVKAGEEIPAVLKSEEIGNIGLSICYDLRFPEYYRELVQEGAEILSIPSAFTYTTGKDHWEPLLKARAIENTAYVFAPAQTGMHGSDRKTWGHAMIVDSWGNVVADAGEEPGIAIGEIDPKVIRKTGDAIPSLRHRKFWLN